MATTYPLASPEVTVPDPSGNPVADTFGHDVSVFGGTLLVGDPDHNQGSGAAYLFSS